MPRGINDAFFANVKADENYCLTSTTGSKEMKTIIVFTLLLLGTWSCRKDDKAVWEVKKSLAFAIATNDSTAHLWYVAHDGRSMTRLLPDNIGSAADNPAWAQDGRRIYFVRRTRSRGANGIFSIKSDGSDLREVIRDEPTQLRNFFQPVLDRKNKSIYFSLEIERTGRKVIELFRMSISGSQVTRLTDFETGSTGLVSTESYAGSVSPNDSLLVFCQGNPALAGVKDVRIYIMDVFTGNTKLIRTVRSSGVMSCTPVFSPDGDRLLFSNDGQVYTMRIDGSDLKNHSPLRGYHPVWDPGGKEIYMSSFGVPDMRRGIYQGDITITSIRILSRSSGLGFYGGLSINKF